MLAGADVVVARAVREPAARARPDGDERDRRGARVGRRGHGVGVDPGPVRCPRRPRRGARAARRRRCARSRPTWAVGSARSCRSIPSTWRWRRPRCSRPAGPVGRDAQREHARPHPRARAGPARARSAPGATARSSGCGPTCSRTWAPIRSAAFLPVTTQEMLSGVYAIPRDRVPWPERRDERDPDRALPRRRASGGDRADRARDRPGGRRARPRPCRGPADEPDPARRLPVHDGLGHHVRLGRLRTRARRGAADRRTTPALRAEQAARRARGDHLQLGIGLCTYVEITSFSSKEFGSVEVRPDGGVTVLTGVTPNGQGHETAFAQIDRPPCSGCRSTPCVWCIPTRGSSRGARARGGRGRCRRGDRRSSSRPAKVVEKARRSPRTCSRPTRPTSTRRPMGASRCAARRTGRSRGPSSPPRPPIPRCCPRAWSPGSCRRAGSASRRRSFPFGAHVAVVEVDIETGDGAVGPPHRGRRLRPDPEPDARRGPGARRAGPGHRAGALRGGRATTSSGTR